MQPYDWDSCFAGRVDTGKGFKGRKMTEAPGPRSLISHLHINTVPYNIKSWGRQKSTPLAVQPYLERPCLYRDELALRLLQSYR